MVCFFLALHLASREQHYSQHRCKPYPKIYLSLLKKPTFLWRNSRPARTNFVVKSLVTLPPNPSANMAWLRSDQRLNQCRMHEFLQKTKYTTLFLTLEPFATLKGTTGRYFFASQVLFSLSWLWYFLDNWNAIPRGTLCDTKCSVTAWLMCIHN